MNITDVGHLTDDADDGEDKIGKRARERRIDLHAALEATDPGDWYVIPTPDALKQFGQVKKFLIAFEQDVPNPNPLGFSFPDPNGPMFSQAKAVRFERLCPVRFRSRRKLSLDVPR